ncbi:MAG: AAA family ATPase, partial [Actinobacteria bacterium]|nr:AAA family ATPase [Actinomycetota bacterium]
MPNLILIGAPGSGKTTLGQALATKLNLPFV